MLMSLFRISEQPRHRWFVCLTVLFLEFCEPDIPNLLDFHVLDYPGHYIFEGIIMSQYDGDDTPITASAGSAFSHLPKYLYWKLPETGLLRDFP
jgi:hypothetical protein